MAFVSVVRVTKEAYSSLQDGRGLPQSTLLYRPVLPNGDNARRFRVRHDDYASKWIPIHWAVRTKPPARRTLRVQVAERESGSRE